MLVPLYSDHFACDITVPSGTISSPSKGRTKNAYRPVHWRTQSSILRLTGQRLVHAAASAFFQRARAALLPCWLRFSGDISWLRQTLPPLLDKVRYHRLILRVDLRHNTFLARSDWHSKDQMKIVYDFSCICS